jgi:hypothetical protein
MEKQVNEFDLYCHNKSADGRRRLAQVRDLILGNVPQVEEGRVHFYLVYHLGSGTVAKLHLDAKEQPNVTFVVGSELADPSKLLKGSSLVRTVKVTSDAYLSKHHDAIADLVRQAFEITTLRPDQPSP